MSLASSLTNVKITNNIIDTGSFSNGSTPVTYTYSSCMSLEASAIVNSNTFSGTVGGSTGSTNLISITDGSSVFTKNFLIRGNGSPINAYINITSLSDQIITENIFDQATTNGTSEDLVPGLPGGSIYEKNKNQTIYIPVTLADKIATKSQWTGGGVGLGSIMGAISTAVSLSRDSANYLNIGISTLTNSYFVSWNANVTESIPFGAQVLEFKVGLLGSQAGATLATNDIAVGFNLAAKVDSILPSNYSAGTGSILDLTRRSLTTDTASTFYDVVTNFSSVTSTTQYITVTPSSSTDWINNGNNAIILEAYIATRLTAGSINWLISPVVMKCRW